MVTDEQCWALIDRTREQAKGDSQEHMIILEEYLAKWEAEKIVAFDRFLHERFTEAYHTKIWKDVDIMTFGGCIEDFFIDLRGWLISQGKEAFESFINDPETICDFVDGQVIYEGFMYVPGYAWARVTGNESYEMPEHDIAYTKIWGPDLMDMGDKY